MLPTLPTRMITPIGRCAVIAALASCPPVFAAGQPPTIRNQPGVAADSPENIVYLTRTSRQKALQQNILDWSWTNAQAEHVFQQIERQLRVPILLDRRIDPSIQLTVQFTGITAETVLEELADSLGGEIRIIGDCVYVGPPEACADLRTLIELRREQAAQMTAAIRRMAARKHAHDWHTLSTPREVLETVTATLNVDLKGLEQVPHDLWRAERVANLNTIELLSFLLIQFQLTFEWTDNGRSIQIVKIKQRPQIERSYRVTAGEAEELAAAWKPRVPGAQWQVQGSQITVRGSLDDHERIELLKAGKDPDQPASTSPTAPVPLRKRTFTLRVKDVPAAAIMAKLNESGVVFEYDQQALKQAGIDLSRFVEVNVKDARAAEFLDAVFGPLGVKASYRGFTVKLVPAP